ncbi:hypothetical protein POJ06DRAFT_32966 [Lipomyces tetrasporus]|uniref:EXPERA domain-containing protein n=1 Tax=Lipomyces tetrasporus TaxID=54092 RepID=A0AAD7QLH0_9ASCO|nr:uncharacterized protein POJ06DRAFT_32966 [Lipomyces tetrasporus]KAJ8097486.1 hypothetical protein POJ06DRAFT_32966 [Lipomyces tetrasporus]
MAYYYKPITLVAAWFLLSNLVVTWDASYVLSRPHSFPGGTWHFLWKPYALYGQIDYVYGLPAFEASDGFPSAQAFMTLVEAVFNYFYLYTSYFCTSPCWRLAGAIIGMMSATSCFSKTVLYMLCEIFSGFKYVGHNTWFNFLFLYVVPSSPWILVSLYAMIAIAGQLHGALMSVPNAAAEKKTK